MAEIKRHSGLSGVVVKAMGLFTGVQAVEILCSIVRTKLVALWIGAVGVGLFGLFNGALDMINSLVQLSMRSSTIPTIAATRGMLALQRICYVIRRWSWSLGLIGAFLTLTFSPLLSRLTFGDDSHTLGFIILSISVFLAAITSGELAILQGTGQLSRMARASVIGALAGLAISAPLFYFFGIESVVPAIITYSIVTAAAALIMRNRTGRPDTVPSLRETFNEGLGFVRLGVFMTASAFITLAASYVFLVWLNRSTDTETVGYYQAGFTIINRYLGLVFTAIAMEYYPRLSSVSNSNRRISTFVGHEMSVTLIVILPIATLFMAVDDIIIRILYQSHFVVATNYVTWGLAGTAFRAVSWCMAFVILARGDGKIYLVTETTSALLSLALNILFYSKWGLTGLGIAYVIWYASYTLIVGIVYFGRYRLTINNRVVMLTLIVTAITIVTAYTRDLEMRLPAIIVAIASTLAGIAIMRRLLHR